MIKFYKRENEKLKRQLESARKVIDYYSDIRNFIYEDDRLEEIENKEYNLINDFGSNAFSWQIENKEGGE